MSIDSHGNTNKLNRLLQSWPSDTVALSPWLERLGVSAALRQTYRRSGWIEQLGYGAYTRPGDKVDWLGGLYAIQSQAGKRIHAGGRAALGLQGRAHYLELDAKTTILFAPNGVRLPPWFKQNDWGIVPRLFNTDFLPPDVGIVDIEHKSFTVKASGAARACLECLYLAPEHFDLVEAYQIVEGLPTVRPGIVQQLLESCRSDKVTRLFLFLAEKAGHAWFPHLDLSKIAMRASTRTFATDGVYVARYKMTVPKELMDL